jgi:phosphatidylglycerol:prolipoprotein diacylglycerol transferase
MHPVFLKFGSFTIHTYGVLVALGFLIGLSLAGRRGQRDGIEPQIISDLGVWLIVVGMVGAKLFHIVFFWEDFSLAWRIEGVRSLREGFVFYGGFIGASIATIVYAQRHQILLWKLADLLAPLVALGHVFGRLGCFFHGCCFGYPSHASWAVRYPAAHMMHDIPVHPTQLYEVAGNLVLFAALSLSSRRKRFDGQIWWWYVFAYGALRFGIEFFRGDYDMHYFGIFTIAQLVAMTLIVIAAVALWCTKRLRGEMRRL